MNSAQTVPGEHYYYSFEEIHGHAQPKFAEAKAPASLDNYAKPRVGDERFWRRLFSDEIALSQQKFDWCMGVVLPMVCFYFDPIVFRTGEIFDGGFLHSYQYPAYSLAFLAIMANMAWLLWGERMGRPFAAVVVLILGSASLAALLIGIVLLPFSLIGMFFLVGFLGFTPLLSAVVYGRNAFRAMRSICQD